jgi:hypothetical protein
MRWQKFSPLDREHPIFELLDDDGAILLDVSRNNDGVLEVCFHSGIRDRIVDFETVQRWLADGRDRVERDQDRRD